MSAADGAATASASGLTVTAGRHHEREPDARDRLDPGDDHRGRLAAREREGHRHRAERLLGHQDGRRRRRRHCSPGSAPAPATRSPPTDGAGQRAADERLGQQRLDDERRDRHPDRLAQGHRRRRRLAPIAGVTVTVTGPNSYSRDRHDRRERHLHLREHPRRDRLHRRPRRRPARRSSQTGVSVASGATTHVTLALPTGSIRAAVLIRRDAARRTDGDGDRARLVLGDRADGLDRPLRPRRRPGRHRLHGLDGLRLDRPADRAVRHQEHPHGRPAHDPGRLAEGHRPEPVGHGDPGRRRRRSRARTGSPPRPGRPPPTAPTPSAVPAGSGYKVTAKYGAGSVTSTSQTRHERQRRRTSRSRFSTGSIKVTVQNSAGTTYIGRGPHPHRPELASLRPGRRRAAGTYTFSNVPAGSGAYSVAANLRRRDANVDRRSRSPPAPPPRRRSRSRPDRSRSR